MKVVLLSALLVTLQLGGVAQDGAKADSSTVQFGLDRRATGQAYHFLLHEDGTGVYSATYPPTPPATPGETVDVPVMLHAGTARKIFEEARSTVVLHGNCENKAKNIAQTGIKSLTFTGPDGAKSECSWNYSEKAAVAGLQEQFIAMAATLDTARKLRMEQRFDRLGMDHEIAFLLEQVKDGHAQGLENIAPLLEEIVADQSLLERVRSKAKILLDMSRVER